MKKICKSCGHVGPTKTITRGSILVELILWLCFLVPGLIYSIWRLTSRYEACEMCKGADIIPLNSPLARQLLNASNSEPASNNNETACPYCSKPVSQTASVCKHCKRVLSA